MASKSTALDAPQPADPSKSAGPQAEVADTDVEMQDAETKDAAGPSSSDSKHKGDMTGKGVLQLETAGGPVLCSVNFCHCFQWLLPNLGRAGSYNGCTLQESTSSVVY